MHSQPPGWLERSDTHLDPRPGHECKTKNGAAGPRSNSRKGAKSAWGRFMQVDGIGYSGGINAYVGNDPLNLVDPFGFTRDSPWGVNAPSLSQNDSSFTTPSSQSGLLFATPEIFTTPAPSTPESQLLQLAAMDESMLRGKSQLLEGGGGGGPDGGFGGSTSGGRNPWYSPPPQISGEESGPPASSFSGSLRNPLQAPIGPPRNLPGEFNGQPYTGHAFDALQNRGIPPSVVDQAINRGIPNPGNTPGTTRFYDPTNNMSVVRDNATGNIITVRPGN